MNFSDDQEWFWVCVLKLKFYLGLLVWFSSLLAFQVQFEEQMLKKIKFFSNIFQVLGLPGVVDISGTVSKFLLFLICVGFYRIQVSICNRWLML